MSEQDDSYLDELEDELVEKKIEIEQLEKWIAAVPIDALRRQYNINVINNRHSFVQDAIVIDAWLRSLEPQP